jgi:parallel beta helix pectate lyase-like protein
MTLRARIASATTFSALLLASTAFAVTRNVPADHPTIQAAINASMSGDLILVAPGTYFEHLVLGPSQSGVSVTSSGGPAMTILDGASTGSVVTMTDCGPTTRLIGFTIEHGGSLGVRGGALRLTHSSPIVSGNLIRDNHPGDGILFLDLGSAPLVSHNTIVDNEGIQGSGAISCHRGSTPVIEYNLIARNRVVGEGGGIAVFESSSATLRHNTIVANLSFLTAGGIYVRDAQVICHQNIIAFNSGGGVLVFTGSLGASFDCDDLFGNSGYDVAGIPSPVGVNGVISLDPLFCNRAAGDYGLETGSPAAPAQSPTCGLRGAVDPACGPTAIRSMTWGSLKARYN